MAKLTQADQRLLRHPPTEKTWECQVKRTHDDMQVVCGMVNSGSRTTCCLCTRPKARQPKLLWPSYLAACKKAGIEPGTRWPLRVEPTEAAPIKKTRRKGAGS